MTAQNIELDAAKAADVMTRDVLSVRVDMTAREVADFFAEHEISGAPVVNEEGKLVGVVTMTDIAEQGAQEAEELIDHSNPEYYVRALDAGLDLEDMRRLHIENEDRLARDIMTPSVYTVPADMPVRDVAGEMIRGHIHRLFVTDLGGRVVGVVTAIDLLKLIEKG
jgi:CBS domain-containing protein